MISQIPEYTKEIYKKNFFAKHGSGLGYFGIAEDDGLQSSMIEVYVGPHVGAVRSIYFLYHSVAELAVLYAHTFLKLHDRKRLEPG